MSSSAYLWVWSPLLHTPYTSSPNHYHPFATHVHNVVACFAVIAFAILAVIIQLEVRQCNHKFSAAVWRWYGRSYAICLSIVGRESV